MCGSDEGTTRPLSRRFLYSPSIRSTATAVSITVGTGRFMCASIMPAASSPVGFSGPEVVVAHERDHIFGLSGEPVELLAGLARIDHLGSPALEHALEGIAHEAIVLEKQDPAP